MKNELVAHRETMGGRRLVITVPDRVEACARLLAAGEWAGSPRRLPEGSLP